MEAWETRRATSTTGEVATVSARPRYRKVYAIWRGCNLGLYYTWVEYEQHVKGFLGAKYKGFKLWAEANEWLSYKGS